MYLVLITAVNKETTQKGTGSFKYGKGDRLEQQEKIQYIYDAVGNLIQKRQADGSSVSYEYDADNQLIAVSTETKGRIEFKYDAFGRRTTKITDAGATGFLWDGDVLLSENKDSQPAVEYVHEGFVPLAKIKDSQIETYHTDYLGTPKEVTDEAGAIVWQGNYDEYGKVTAVKSQTEQNIRFQGQYEDEETGLFYNRFRYYDADGCRYIHQDPIKLASGETNIYSYVYNPNSLADPLGLTPWGDKGIKFGDWWNNHATPESIRANKQSVEAALRGMSGGSNHEKFPVSIADKAKELGFTFSELEKLTTKTAGIKFTGVTDSKGMSVPDGDHHGSRAGRHFHIKLINALKNAKTKAEAEAIIKSHHDAHMKDKC